MMMSIQSAQAVSFLTALAVSSIRTIVLAAGAGLLLKLLRVTNTRTRLSTWTAVLCAGLTMPFLGWLLPQVPVPIGFLPTSASASLTSGNVSRSAPIPPIKSINHDQSTTGVFVRSGEDARSNVVLRDQHEQAPLRAGWTKFALIAYCLIAFTLLFKIAIGLIFSRRLVRSSTLIRDPRITLRQPSRRQLSLSRGRETRVYESSLISVPVTSGVLSPAILLPASWREWGDEKLDAVLTHEMSHVARHDSLVQVASLLHRAIFWFSPLAWWLNRQIINLAEQASDEAALSSGAGRNDYAKTLLGFFELVQAGPGRVRWQGVAMANAGNAQRRLEKILAWKRGENSMNVKKSSVIMMLVFALPAAYVVAAARPVPHGQVSPTAQIAGNPTESNALPQASAGVPPPVSSTATATTDSSQSAQETDQGSETSDRQGFSYHYGSDDDQRFVIVSGKTDSFTMSGSGEDASHVEKLRKQISGDFIWFQRDEKSYIIRDQATIDRARKLWAPQEELGRKQEELGKQQEALGKQQEELGARMEKVQVKVPDMTAQLDKLKAELQKLGPNATIEQIGEIQSEIGELQSKIGELQSNAGEEQSKVGSEMGVLGEQQGKLGEKQGELGRQQAELAKKATREMKQIFDNAIKSGLAQPEAQTTGSI